MNEEILLQKIGELKNGSLSALGEIYNFFNKRLSFFINAYTGNKQETEEIVQDVFVKLWNHRSSIKDVSSAKSYIYTIAKNSAIDYIRKRKLLVFPLDSLKKNEPFESNQGELNLLIQEENSLINTAIDNLSPRRKEVFKLHRNENLTYKEISERLGISVSAVEKNLSAALKEIRNSLYRKSL